MILRCSLNEIAYSLYSDFEKEALAVPGIECRPGLYKVQSVRLNSW